MDNLKRILTKPDHSLNHIVEATGDMRVEEVLQVEIQSYSRPIHVMKKITEAYPHTDFLYETFKSKEKLWMYITIINPKTKKQRR